MSKNIAVGEIVVGTVIGSVFNAAFNAIDKSITGSIGKYSLSFFNPALASTAGTFATFAGVGALAGAMMTIPLLIKNTLIQNSSYLKQKPHFRAFLNDTLDILIQLGAVAASAAILGYPIAATLVCMAIIPAALYLLRTCINVLAAVISPENSQFQTGNRAFASM